VEEDDVDSGFCLIYDGNWNNRLSAVSISSINFKGCMRQTAFDSFTEEGINLINHCVTFDIEYLRNR